MEIVTSYLKEKYNRTNIKGKKLDYIEKRIMGYEVGEALKLINVQDAEYNLWLTDTIFKKIDNTDMGNIRIELSEKISKEYYNKAFFLIMQKDIKVLEMALENSEALTPTDKQYLFKIQNRYDGRLLESLNPKKKETGDKVTWNLFLQEVLKETPKLGPVVEGTSRVLDA